jgi:hypothetical protein
MVDVQMKKQVLSTPHILEEKAFQNKDSLVEDLQNISDTSQLLKLLRIEQNKLEQLQKRRVNNFDKCLQL